MSLIFFVLQGCLESPHLDGTGDGARGCTTIGSFHTIRVVIAAAGELPPNLAATLNGTNQQTELCRPEDPGMAVASVVTACFASPVVISPDRTEVSFQFNIDADRANFDHYFPYPHASPVSDLADFQLLTRNSCDDNLTLFRNIEDLSIRWEPVYANGEKCGRTSYSGTVEIELGDDFF